MIVKNRIGVALALLLSVQVSSLADMTRVEAYHNSKHSGPSRSDIDRSHRYLLNGDVYNNRRIASHHRGHVVQVPQRVRPIYHDKPSHRSVEYRFSHLYPNAYRFRHNGHRYAYNQGIFYRPYNQGFRVVEAPLGAIVLSLPIGNTHLRISNRDYYRYHDVYYQREFGVRGYRVVSNPYRSQTYCYQVGSMVDTLPLGARDVIIDNVRYYEYENYYFKPQRRNGIQMYLVVNF